MAEAVARDAARTAGVLMVEAGTGVGKSLAYLVPAVLWARANAASRSWSPPTRSNLQEQLIARTCRSWLAGHARAASRRRCSRAAATTSACAARRGCSATPPARSSGASAWRCRTCVAWLAPQPGGDLEALSPEASEAVGGPRRLIVDRVRSQGDVSAWAAPAASARPAAWSSAPASRPAPPMSSSSTTRSSRRRAGRGAARVLAA